jgi:cytochrome c biogenesis protein CcmG/thiol:disulfide interchange protein DsbE
MSQRKGPNFIVLIVGLLISAGFVTLLGVGFLFNPRALPDAMTGKSAPSFTLIDLDGNEVDFNDVRGKPIVINFWSTWCVPCKQEHPVLLEAAKLYPEVQFYGVIYQDDAEPIRQYLRRNGTAYPHLIDPESRVAIDMGVAGVPETYFIDRTGIIRTKASFPVWNTYLADEIERIMEENP